MSLTSDYLKLREERLKKEEEEKKKKKNSTTTTKASQDKPLYSSVDIAPDNPLFSFNEDIAPVLHKVNSSKKTEKEDTWFDSGAFDDGYQFGDVAKTVGSTAFDAATGIVQGALKLGEGLVDLGAYGVSGVSRLVGADSFADLMKETAKDNVTDIYVNKFRKNTTWDDNSLLGTKSQGVAQGLGQIAGIIATGGAGAAGGLSTAATSVLTTSVLGASSFGSGMSEAYQGGATDVQAFEHGAGIAAVDVISELMFGGLGKSVKALGLSRGISSLDDVFAKKISNAVTKFIKSEAGQKAIGNTLEYAVKSGAEGLEEIAAGLGSAVVKKLTYKSDEELGQLVKDENLLDQFITGTIVSGIAQGGDLVKSVKTNTDFVTGLNTNEQTVVDKEVEKRIAEQEENGKKLTNKEKDKIYDDVLSDLDKGYISTDTIEEALGGDTYKSYKDTTESEDALKKELDELRQMKSGDRNDIQNDRLAELKAMNLDDTTKRDGLKKQLGEEVFGLVKDSRLVESYNERGRRSQAFQADTSKYDEKQRKVIQNAIDSGILNNTNRTHEFVDMIAKISADKGVSFDFTNNERLKESGFAIDGKTINGYVTKDGVTLNIQSAKALNSVVGHETTHVLEGTELYNELQKSVIEYAKSKGDYQERYDALTKLYEGVKDADIDAELTADLVGDYLFTDSDFINNLSTKHRNVFQKIYDEIKYLCKVATAGSKEARELERVKRAFEKAYRESGKASSEIDAEKFYDSDAKYSLTVTDKDTLDFLNKQETITTYKTMQLVDGKLYPPMAARTEGKYEDASVLGTWEQATEHPELIKNGNKFKLDKGKGQGSIEAAYNPYMHSSNLVLNDQFSGAYKRDNLVTVECEVPVSELTSGYHAELAKDSVGWHPWHTGTVAGQLRQAKGTERQVFLSRWIKPVRIVPDSEVAAMYKDLLDGTDVEVPDNVVTPSLLNELKNAGVKIKESGRVKYSLSDSDGKQLTKEQSEFFKDSKVRDENGNLKVMYHGSNEDFTVFDKSKARSGGTYGKGFYFTDSDSHASTYGNLYDVYLNITNPIQNGTNDITKDQLRKFVEAIAEDEDYGIDNYGYDATIDSVTDSVYGKGDFGIILDLNISCIGDMVKAIELFNKVNGTNYDGIVAPTETVAFYPEQIKRTDNKKPTGNPDIRFSLSEDIDTFDNSLYNEIELSAVERDRVQSEALTWHVANKGQPFSMPLSNGFTYLCSLDNDGIVHIYGKEESVNIHEFGGNYDNRNTERPDRYVEKFGNQQGIHTGDNVLVENGRDQIAPFAGNVATIQGKGRSHRAGYSKNDTYAHRNPKGWHFNDDGSVEVTYSDGTKETENAAPIKKTSSNDDVFFDASHDAKSSLSAKGETSKRYGNYNVYGKDIMLEQDVAPVAESVDKAEIPTEDTISDKFAPTAEDIAEFFPSDPTLDDLKREARGYEERIAAEMQKDVPDADTVNRLYEQYKELQKKIRREEAEEAAWNKEQLASLDDADAPPEVEAPYYSLGEDGKPDNPFENRDIKAVGNRKVKAYMYENPEVKPYFQEAANVLLGELNRTQKGERLYTPVPGGVPGEYGSDSYGVWTGVSRQTSPDIAYLLDELHYTYDEIEKGIKAIIEDNGKENNACSKRIEFLLNDRLLKGYPDMDYPDNEDMYTPPNQEYINLLNEKQITEYNEESFKRFMESEEEYAPIAETPAPVTENADVAPVKQTEEKPRKTAEILFEETEGRKKRGIWSLVKEYVLDNGMVFEDISKKHNRRELEARWNSIRNSEKAAQRFIKDGKNGVRSIETLKDEIEQSGLIEDFNYYMYHKHNIDRMSLESRVAPKIAELKEQLGELDDAQIAELAEEKIRRGASAEDANRIRNAKVYTHLMNFKNKAVFGESETAEVSQAKVDAWEKEHPEFKEWAEEVYANNKLLRQFMVDNGILSEETAELWDSLYPHYVPIRRKNQDGAAINVPLDTNKTGINAPIKRATGGDSDFYDLFSTMSQRAIQTYKAVAKNRFGTELLDVLGTTVSQSEAGLNDAMDSVEDNDGLLKAGKHGANPTFTIFEDGKRVEFEISEEMYDAMRPAGDLLSYTNEVANKISNFRRATLTEYSALFLAKNAVKDMQDVFLNSQHAVRTYGAIPEAIKEMATGKGQYIQEYLDNGGEANTYFDSETNSFTEENKAWEAIKTVTGLNAVQKANNVVEMLPRLAEYIASRKMGRSIDVSMLDAARVTTNFAAGGKLTKMLNRNGATFLNASVQGAIQQVRNVREAKMNGLKGVLGLAAKVGLVGGTAMLLNNLMWDDDEEYEELSDYVKQNYYIVGKFGDGKFVRIPKGRATAVIQNAFEQMQNLVTGNDEVDLKAFLDLAVSNLAPNDPIDNNVLSPIMQVKNNETWYGEDLVPSRLQKLPDAEQYDETTDSLSKWLGEKLDFSPYKINYLLDQYSGFVGDAVLPMLTPEAESGDMPIVGDIEQPWLKEMAKLFVAPAYDAFTTDSTMKNQNVSDFYEMMDELTVGANASGATDEDILKSKYMNSINSELGELYAKKREIQNSNLSDAEKYEAVREVQKQITELAENSLNAYDNVSIEEYSTHGVSIGEYANVGDRYFKRNKDGEWEKLDDKELSKFLATKDAGDSYYATDGENHYKWYEPSEDSDEKPSWKKISDDELERQEEVTSGLGISASDYWGNKDEYTYAYKYPGKYAISKAVGGYDTYTSYTSVMNDIGANNDSSSGVKDKDLITEYIFGLDLDYGEKIILYRSKYSSKADKNEYNADIVDYLNSRDDISYEEMVTILEELDMTIGSDGYVYWD